jgi:Kringle domain
LHRSSNIPSLQCFKNIHRCCVVIEVLCVYLLYCSALIESLNNCSECRRSTLGTDYIGHRNTTVNGRTCQAWSSQFPHAHIYKDPRQFPDDTIEDAGNYCRNPTPNTQLQGPYCYTTDPDVRIDLCDIPACPGCNSNYSIVIPNR